VGKAMFLKQVEPRSFVNTVNLNKLIVIEIYRRATSA